MKAEIGEKLKFTLKNAAFGKFKANQCGVRNAECGMGSLGKGCVYWLLWQV